MASPDISESDVMTARAFSALTVTPVTPGIATFSFL